MIGCLVVQTPLILSRLKTKLSEEFIIEELLSLLPEIKCFNKRGKINEVRTANMIARHQSQLIKYVVGL